MKQLILGLALLIATATTFAATEIWMMHDPDCVFCNAFMMDHDMSDVVDGEHTIFLGETSPWTRATIVVINLYDSQNTPDRVIAAINERKLKPFHATPAFYLWDTETKSVIKQRIGWHKSMKEDFRNWVLTGDDPK